MVFVNSMSDLFHERVPEPFIERVAQVMLHANWHTYQVLTKRATRLQSLLSGSLRHAAQQQHIWWGVSVEDRKYGLPRIQALRESSAVVRFLSIEPLLQDLGQLDLRGINWVIVGGESGPGARPLVHDWVVSIKDQCQAAGVPFFFKQWGGVQKGKNGRILDGRTYDEFPKRTRTAVPPLRQRRRFVAELQTAST
jgi:protein gp37